MFIHIPCWDFPNPIKGCLIKSHSLKGQFESISNSNSFGFLKCPNGIRLCWNSRVLKKSKKLLKYNIFIQKKHFSSLFYTIQCLHLSVILHEFSQEFVEIVISCDLSMKIYQKKQVIQKLSTSLKLSFMAKVIKICLFIFGMRGIQHELIYTTYPSQSVLT